jgi:hypothetical protein
VDWPRQDDLDCGRRSYGTKRFKTHREAEIEVFEYIENWYNLHRRRA